MLGIENFNRKGDNMFSNKELKIAHRKVDSYLEKKMSTDDFQNISNTKLEEKIEKIIALAEKREAELYQILAAVPDPILLRDKDKNIVYWNKAMDSLVGVGFEEMKGKKCNEVFNTDACNTCPVDTCINNKESITDQKVSFAGRDGNQIHALMSAAGLYDSEGVAQGGLEIVRDITREKNLLDNIKEAAEEASSISEEVSASSEEIAGSVQELANSANYVSDTSQKGKDLSEMTNQKADEGQNAVKETIEKMKIIEESVNGSTKIVTDLNEQIKEVEKITELITTITDQTNLLALNAAIEAARAGEAGKGFAVVSDEVRKLAEESKNAADSIKKIVGEILKGADDALKSMVGVKESVYEGVEVLKVSTSSLDEILEGVKKTQDFMENVASSAEQTAATTEEQASSMQEITSSMENLLHVSNKLNDQVRDFSL